MKLYEEIAYAKTRLLESIVMCDGEPVYITNIARLNVLATFLSTGEEKQVKYSDLDITPVKLGYVNLAGTSYYLTRTPMRQDWRQGLRSRNMRFSDGRQAHVDNASLYRTIKGIYPKLGEVVDGLGKYWNASAFSRNFSVDNERNLFFKGSWKVGQIDRDKNYELIPAFDWVREMCEEELAVA